MICLALTGKNIAENLRAVEGYSGQIDMCEMRADFLEEWDVAALRNFPVRAGLPVIFTLRREEDGGFWHGTEEQRVLRILEVLSPDYSWVDLESGSDTQAVAEAARRQGTGIIRSQHDFSGVPENFARKITQLPEAADEIPKYAVMPRSTADLRRIISAMKQTHGRRIILGMGEWGFATRILSRYFGCWFTFVSPAGSSAAPGHIDPDMMERIYHFRKTDQETEIYGIIGNPVMHSQSPGIHNPAYGRENLNAVYIPFQVDDLEAWFALADEIPVRGFSVTIPHKSKVISFLNRMSPEVEGVGACNTVFHSSEGWEGVNTDVQGFLSPLEPFLTLKNSGALRATVVGAGGAARAVVYGLKKAGFEVLVVNRTADRARSLAETFGCAWSLLSPGSYGRIAEYDDLLVQTTSVGMHPDVEGNPLEGYPWTGREIAYDLIYTPAQTRFLSAASARGCRILNGLPMLQEQGKLQYRFFTGRPFPDGAESEAEEAGKPFPGNQ